MSTIRAGEESEAVKLSGDWAFVDIGFAQKKATCGLACGEGQPEELPFFQLSSKIAEILKKSDKPLNLLIEAPLSVAFNVKGNPTGRSVERRENIYRYWYFGLGCSVLVAATYLLRNVADTKRTREVRLFEGLASFKTKGNRSLHTGDVHLLRRVIWEPESGIGRVVPASELAIAKTDRLQSAFLVAGMDFGVPPVIELL